MASRRASVSTLVDHRSQLRPGSHPLTSEPTLLLLDDMDGADMITLTKREHDRIDEYRAGGARLLNTARRPRYAHGD